MSAPVAVASIQLSEDERKRIAAELGLSEADLDAVPKKLDIAKYEREESESDVEGFSFNAHQMSFQGVTPGLDVKPLMRVGFVPKYLLVAV